MQKGKEQATPYSPLLLLHYIHSLKTCVSSLLHTNVQVEQFYEDLKDLLEVTPPKRRHKVIETEVLRLQ